MAGIGNLATAASAKIPADKAKTISKSTVSDIVKWTFEELVRLVRSGETVSIQGVGNFRVVDRKATKARNPKTGVQFDVGPSKRLKFQASKTLKETLNPNLAKTPAKVAAAPAKAAAGGKT